MSNLLKAENLVQRSESSQHKNIFADKVSVADVSEPPTDICTHCQYWARRQLKIKILFVDYKNAHFRISTALADRCACAAWSGLVLLGRGVAMAGRGLRKPCESAEVR